MRYYRDDAEGVLIAVGTGVGNAEISEAEYNQIIGIIKGRPKDEAGFEYVLTSDLLWEKREVISVSSEISDAEALDIILGGGVL